jgi:hypothetical protein
MSEAVQLQEQVPPEVEPRRRGHRFRFPRVKPFAILGSGPAGLLAAHALALADREFDIFSLGEPSRLVGPQYLYQHIPEVTGMEPEGYVHQVCRGTMEGYRRKLYGSVDPGWIERPLAPGYNAWSLLAVYERLWLLYSARVKPMEIGPKALAGLLSSREYGRIISTIPATAICASMHRFTAWSILVADRMVEPIADNTIVFNGQDSPAWVRESNIFGRQTTEWPLTILDPARKRTKPPLPDMYEFEKPLRTNCDCFPEVIRMGRFGKWRNETWAHDAYNEAKELVK